MGRQSFFSLWRNSYRALAPGATKVAANFYKLLLSFNCHPGCLESLPPCCSSCLCVTLVEKLASMSLEVMIWNFQDSWSMHNVAFYTDIIVSRVKQGYCVVLNYSIKLWMINMSLSTPSLHTWVTLKNCQTFLFYGRTWTTSPLNI